MRWNLRVSPATAIATVALFFAVGGSAFAVGTKVAPQARCQNGAVKAFAHVTGEPTKGIANLPETFSGAASLFGQRFNCSGKAVEVRLVGQAFQVRFPGTAVRNVLANAVGPTPAVANVTPLPDGSFRVVIGAKGAGDPALQPQTDIQFMVVAF